jgi:hypothetical protein
MPEVEFTINSETGELRVHVKGVVGPACDDVAKVAKELLGEPIREERTAEYGLRTSVRPEVRPKGQGR